MPSARVGVTYNALVGPIPAEYQQYAAMYPEMEVISAKFWDTQTYVSGTTIQLPGWFGTKRATNDLSNMVMPSMFSSPNAYLIRVIRFFIKQRARAESPTVTGTQPSAVDNVAGLINTAVWELTIGAKQYNQEPLWVLTAGAGASGVLAATGQFAGATLYSYAQNGISDPAAVNSLSKPLFIPPMLSFSGLIYWPAAVTLTGNLDITILLDGDLLRPVQ